MSPEMRVALEIAAAAAVLLFAAIGALVGLMYLLTNPSVFGEPARARRRARRTARRMKRRAGAEVEPAAPTREDRLDEQDRRRRAAALAAAIARAEHDSSAVPYVDAPTDWRMLHRELRLAQRAERQ